MAVLRPKPTRRKTHRLPAAKSTSRATAIHPARLPVPPAALHRAGWVERWHWSSKAELWSEQPACRSAKPPVKVDVSKIKVGVKVKHKAFGIGTVAAIQPDMVTVRFGSVEKKFLLPAAIVQGYLSLMEN